MTIIRSIDHNGHVPAWPASASMTETDSRESWTPPN